ncbi:MAG: bifunctional N(6)-L-threonylcarbamoyladenine synthase/serine/threonine protein kinase, partial [Halobacteriales archaeon]|nr:bifunctional N(6)-L-threonylcarbamoyladenine synthase/serine/threonine protein kinase [Halobacteriales archaeon]
ALAQARDVPIVGVNHMVAHLEVGRHFSGFEAPIGLNASGANAHVLAFHDGRYRILGETMDTGVGNALDKFARHVGWGHPGGPKIEEAAADGSYLDLPYVVKGMDFSFAGISSAANEAYDDGAAVEDICCGLQETVFGMLTEVTERALSLTDRSEVVLGGGVGQNARLQAMLSEMCGDRGASFYAPEGRFLRDNAGMIAILGAKMLAAGDTLPVDASRVDPDFRPDAVSVSWRESDAPRRPPASSEPIRGAEATVEIRADTVVKRRLPKPYRHPALDKRLRRERTAAEARLTHESRRLGVPTPTIRDLDLATGTIVFEAVGDHDLGATPTPERVGTVAHHLARLHDAGLVHGDPTTRNVRVDEHRVYLIDFGLGYHSADVEDYAMDIHVLEQSLAGTVASGHALLQAVEAAYGETGDPAVLDRLREIEA